ncbi:MAG: hypothetical protein R2692_00035 [Microbacterium sp.]
MKTKDAVRSLGKSVFAFQMQALAPIIAAGGIITAMGTNVNPNVYVTSQTFFVWTALLLGGAATIFGPVLGAVLFWMVRAFLSNLLPAMVQAGLLLPHRRAEPDARLRARWHRAHADRDLPPAGHPRQRRG